MWKFIRNWTLPLAMLTGALGYFLLAGFPFLNPLKPSILQTVEWLTPSLIFAQLLLTFCKMEPKDLKPCPWHGWLLALQILTSGLIALWLISFPMEASFRIAFQGLMVCLICPTATAAAVITHKLGGSASTLTTYTLLSNLMAAIIVPLVFPLVEPHAGLTFWAAFFKILGKVFPLLLSPFIVALLLRRFVPSVHRVLMACHGAAFYLWAVALVIVTGQTVRSLVTGTDPVSVELLVAFGGLLACAIQFFLGKRIGSAYDDRISAGQALGQKNTVLAIWMACTYLNPLSSVAPGSYVIWQNLFNSWQLWKKRKGQD